MVKVVEEVIAVFRNNWWRVELLAINETSFCKIRLTCEKCGAIISEHEYHEDDQDNVVIPDAHRDHELMDQHECKSL